jgi:hypothetical protein
LLRHLQMIAGIALIVAGLLGTILPIIPGIPLLLAGAALLGAEHPLIRPFARRINRWRNRNRNKNQTGSEPNDIEK